MNAQQVGEVLAETASDVGEHFTCGEADTLAMFLAMNGETEAASVFILGHAAGDIEDDDIHGPDWTRADADAYVGNWRVTL